MKALLRSDVGAPSITCFVAALTLVIGLGPDGTRAAERVVLCEEFTATW